MSAGQSVTEDTLLLLCNLPDGTQGRLYTVVQKLLDPMRNDPVIAQLTLSDCKDNDENSLENMFENAEKKKTPEVHRMR